MNKYDFDRFLQTDADRNDVKRGKIKMEETDRTSDRPISKYPFMVAAIFLFV